MFPMLTCFNLAPDVSIDEFRQALDEFYAVMRDEDLLHAYGPIGRRQSDTIMDTDDERDHEYFFTTTFRDRAQCDRAVDYIMPHDKAGDAERDQAERIIPRGSPPPRVSTSAPTTHAGNRPSRPIRRWFTSISIPTVISRCSPCPVRRAPR